jgi:hypothetical protein
MIHREEYDTAIQVSIHAPARGATVLFQLLKTMEQSSFIARTDPFEISKPMQFSKNGRKAT